MDHMQKLNAVSTPVARFKKIHDVKSSSPCLKMPASPFLERLGYGTGVGVFLVERSPHQGPGLHRSPWAVKKVMRQNCGNGVYAKRLKEEASILKSLDHKNIVGFRALTKTDDGSLCLALEYGEISLFDMIERRMEEELGPFPSDNIMRVASDIASALFYLHKKKCLLHGDMKSGNVLIKGKFALAKLCDFGVTVKLDENLMAPASKYIGTETWSAKEALDKSGFVSDKTDIYSFGLVIYEMLSLNLPHFDNFPNEEDFETEEEYEKAFEEAEVNFKSYLGTRPLLPQQDFKKEYDNAIGLFYTCTDEDQRKRPSAETIVTSLQDVYTDGIKCELNFE